MKDLRTWGLGLALGAALVLGAVSWRRAAAAESELVALRVGLSAAGPPAPDPGSEWRDSIDGLGERVAELAARLAAFEREPRKPVDEVPASEERPAAIDAEPAAGGPQSTSGQRAEFAMLMDSLFGPGGDFSGSPEETERFWELARGTSVVDEWMKALEDQVALDPGNPELRMRLADAYVAKLYTVPGGPEQGRWGGKAEQQWNATLDIDPGHWEAHYSLGNNFAYYPDVMDKTKEAIAHLERAREIQERLVPSDEHIQTYLLLSRLYMRQGRLDEARSTLELGLHAHPGDTALREALAELPE